MQANTDPQSSIAARTSSPPLQRGKACLACRRRKMKCDGARPVCTPCLRGERMEDCEYTDGQHRPRTLVLEEDVARLRARLRELENPGDLIPSVQLHAPYAGAGPSTAGSTSMGHASSGYYQPGSSSYAVPSGVVADPHQLDRDSLSVIAPYAAELGLFLDLDRLRVPGTPVLPALQSALALWCVHIESTSEPDPESLERTHAVASHLLSQAQSQLASALTTVDAEPDPVYVLHLIQTGVLLAHYMHRIGQVVGARYYASGTWTLGMMLRLHRIPSLSRVEDEDQSLRGLAEPPHGHGNLYASTFADYAKLALALDVTEAEERVRAFWAVYALDRWFSAVGKWPPQWLPVDAYGTTVPWPEIGPIPMDEARNVMQHLVNDPNHDFTRDDAYTIHAKASVLLCEAEALAASYATNNAISQSPAFQVRFGTLDALLPRCMNAAMTLTTGQGEGQAFASVHLAAFAQVTLHRPFATTSYVSSRRCVEAALGVVSGLDQMGEAGIKVAHVNPVYATVWTVLCLALHDEMGSVRERTDAPSRGEMVAAIRRLVGVLSVLSQRYPSRFFAIKIEALFPVLESITL